MYCIMCMCCRCSQKKFKLILWALTQFHMKCLLSQRTWNIEDRKGRRVRKMSYDLGSKKRRLKYCSLIPLCWYDDDSNGHFTFGIISVCKETWLFQKCKWLSFVSTYSFVRKVFYFFIFCHQISVFEIVNWHFNNFVDILLHLPFSPFGVRCEYWFYL